MNDADPHADELYQQALAAADAGDFSRAVQLLRDLVAHTDHPGHHCTLARVHCQLGDYGAAAAAYAAAANGDPSVMSARDHYDHGAVLGALGDLQQAEQAYRRALVGSPGWPLALDNLAVTLQLLGRLAEAETCYRQALVERSAEERAFSLRNLASLLLASGRSEEAAVQYRELVQLAPADPRGHYDLAVALHALDDLAGAEASYRQALALAPQRTDVRRHLADLLLADDRPVEAEACYRQVLASEPEDADALSGLSTCLNALERLDEALEVSRQAVRLQPDDARLLHNLGVVGERAGAFNDALDAYRAAVAVAPEMVEAQANLAALLYRLGHLDESRERYQMVLELDPHDHTAHHLLAALTGGNPACAPADYVAGIFDGYADRYDQHMTEALGYRAPVLLSGAILETLQVPAGGFRALDLGCGTGMMAAALKDHLGVAHGIDLSQGMLDVARERGLYAQLWQADIVAALGDTTRGLPTYDLVLAADVLVYVGDLAPLCAAVRERLAPTGGFAFTVEAHELPGYALRTTGRYAHHRDYVEHTAAAHGFGVATCQTAVVRMESEVPVHGSLFVLTPRP